MITKAGDRAGRTDIETAGTTADLVTRMGADGFIKIDINRFFKFTDKLHGLAFNFCQGDAVISLRTQITVTLFPASEQRGIAGQIDQYVATCLNAIHGRTKHQVIAAMRGRFGKFIDDQIKMREMPGCRLDAACRHKPAIGGGV